ncbi:hypothetical protein [Yersinia ruckeri]|uniref:hypothetical protein n=1 Tax=Yersinia ruckeri TaxID=29486 RepID=UPI0022377480|nr:hypothetical protein [Yersinia ruckeri]MCW6567573.1 hypothetical protein [Yersinia ruckeri]
MATHAFADMMYHLYQCFGLFKKKDKRREVLRNGSFSYHQSFFGKSNDDSAEGNDNSSWGYDAITKIIDSNKVFSLEERRSFFYKYEQLYNALMHIPVFSPLNNRGVVKLYLRYALPPIVALDVYNTFTPDDEAHFYYHIHRFLMSEHCPCGASDRRLVHLGVKKYLREYIRQLNFHYKDHLSGIFESIANIRIKNGQKKLQIKQVIEICRAVYEENIIPEKDVTANNIKLDKIERAYISLHVLLAFERYTSAVNLLSMHYRHTVRNGINYNSSYGILCRYIYSRGYDETLLHDITLPLYKLAVLPVSVTVDEEPFRYIYELRGIVFNTERQDKYTGWDFVRMSFCLNSTDHSDILSPYSSLLTLICLLSLESLDEAYQLVNDVSLDELPVGYLSSAFAIIKLALKVKLERKTIRNGVLLSLINASMANQGVITDYIAVTEGELKNPIVLCADNMSVMRAIKMYNSMIRKISYLHDVDPSGIYPHAIFGVLDEVERALGKLNTLLCEVDDGIESDKLAELIIEKKILTARELSGNLIGFLDECTLYNCLASLNILVKYLRCPGEAIENIVMFAGATNKSKCVREKVCEALLIANKRLK